MMLLEFRDQLVHACVEGTSTGLFVPLRQTESRLDLVIITPPEYIEYSERD